MFTGKKTGAGFGPIIDRRGEEIDRLEPNLKPGLFACYRMPPIVGKAAENLMEYTQEKYDPQKHARGEVKWYFWDTETKKISEVLEETWTAIRCSQDTKRVVKQGVTKLALARKAIERHIKNTYLRDIQAPIGAKPTLVAWMEIN